MHVCAWVCIIAPIRFSVSALCVSGRSKVPGHFFTCADMYLLVNGNSLLILFIISLFMTHILCIVLIQQKYFLYVGVGVCAGQMM